MPDKRDFVQPKEPLSEDTYNDDWDRSIVSEPLPASEVTSQQLPNTNALTPRNSVVFPVAEDGETTPGRKFTGRIRFASGKGKRTLSELLKLHAEKGTDCRLSPEEAVRLGDVLGQWINASSSPYEGEDDFFKAHDDIALPPKRTPNFEGRLRGQSESAGSRPSSAAGFVIA